jgi:hypothetical protein
LQGFAEEPAAVCQREPFPPLFVRPSRLRGVAPQAVVAAEHPFLAVSKGGRHPFRRPEEACCRSCAFERLADRRSNVEQFYSYGCQRLINISQAIGFFGNTMSRTIIAVSHAYRTDSR